MARIAVYVLLLLRSSWIRSSQLGLHESLLGLVLTSLDASDTCKEAQADSWLFMRGIPAVVTVALTRNPIVSATTVCYCPPHRVNAEHA